MTDITIKSEADFHPALDAQLQGTANDYIHNDPGGKHMRLNAHGQVKDKSSGGLVYVSYTGVVNITPELGAILTGKEGAKSTDFGDSCTCFVNPSLVFCSHSLLLLFVASNS